MARHAKLCPPSGWDRWSICSASVDLQTGEGSIYAAEGTAAHLLADTCFREQLKPHDYIGIRIWVPDAEDEADGVREAFLTPDDTGEPLTGWVFEVDQEMADNVETFMDEVYMQPRDFMQSETEVPIGHITKEDGATGHADVIRIHGTTLATHDLKYGQGKRVYAKDNGQQLLYLLGAIKKMDWTGIDFDTFEVHIHQPRLGSHDVWTLTKEELIEWAKKIGARARRITVDGEREFQPGHEACRFCDYRKQCEARDTLAAMSPDEFPSDQAYEGLDMAGILDRVEFVEQWCADMWAKANDMVSQDPDCIPGWGLFPGRGGRQIKDEEGVKRTCKNLKLKLDQYMPRSLLSAAQIEKLVGKKVYAEKFTDFITKTEGKAKLGRDTGGRKKVNTAENLGFEDLGD